MGIRAAALLGEFPSAILRIGRDRYWNTRGNGYPRRAFAKSGVAVEASRSIGHALFLSTRIPPSTLFTFFWEGWRPAMFPELGIAVQTGPGFQLLGRWGAGRCSIRVVVLCARLVALTRPTLKQNGGLLQLLTLNLGQLVAMDPIVLVDLVRIHAHSLVPLAVPHRPLSIKRIRRVFDVAGATTGYIVSVDRA